MLKALGRPSQLSPELRLAQAISEFEADLLEDEKKEFKIQKGQSPDPLDVMRLTAHLDRSLFAKGFRRGHGPRLTRFLEGVQQFASIGDIMVGGSQYLPACAVWSLVRFSLLSIVQHSDYVDKLSELFMHISRSTPRYQDMALLFPQSKKLQDSFNEYYIAVVRLCHKFMKLSRTSGFKQFLSSYSDTITRFEKQLNTLADDIRDEMNIQSVALAQEENKKSSRFRMLAKIDREALENQHRERKRLCVLDACSVYDYQTAWRQIRKSGNTALHKNDSNYQSWKAAKCKATLVYSGRLGAGKSVLMANIVDDLFLNSTGCYIAYFFCRHDISDSLQARTILGSLARQLLLAHGGLEEIDLPLLSDNNLFSVEDLIQIIVRVCSELDKVVYIVVDGLDECLQKERDLLLDTMRQCQELQELLLCISLRWEPDVQSKFRPTQLTNPMYSNMPEQNLEVEAYIHSEIDNCINSGRLQFTQKELIPVIKDTLGLKSKGMFLWVSLLISYMCSLTSDYDIIQALKELPQSLAEIYQRLLSKYADTQKQYQDAILQLISVAHRPLSTKELREALSIVPGETDWNAAKLSNNIAGLLACCGGIVIIDEEELTVRFVHESARQFLINDDGSRTSSFMTDAEKRMAQIITTYLNFAVFDTRVSTVVTPKIHSGMIVDSVISSVPKNSKLLRSVSNLMKPSNTVGPDISKVLAETAMQARARTLPDLSLEAYAKRYWFLHSAPVLNDLLVQDLVRKLLQKGLEIKLPDISNPLSWAIINGYALAFECLAATGSPLEETMQDAIQIAATKGYLDIIEKYLQSPELFLILDEDLLNFALSARAASQGWSNILKLLLNKTSVQERVWNAIVRNLSIMHLSRESGPMLELTYESFLEAVAKEWPCVLKSFAARALIDDLTWDPVTKHRGISTEEEYDVGHTNIANNCLDLLLSTDCLSTHDICQLRTPGVLRSEIPKQLVNRYLPSEIQYACCHWTRHLRESKCERLSIEDRIYKFLKARFFFWYEAVSLVGKASEMHGMIDDLLNLTPKHFLGDWKKPLQNVLRSAKQFVTENNAVADLAPLQLYYFGVIFAPPDRGLKIREVITSDWLVETRRFSDEKHSAPITSMIFSSDGQLLASASDDQTIKIWDTASGKLQQTLVESTDPINSVVFSPDGKFVASVSGDRTIKIWNIASEKLQQTLVESTVPIRLVTFSPDRKFVASVSGDRTIKLWNIGSGELWRTLKEHTDWVCSVVFSPDGALLASILSNKTINLWDIASGRIKRKIEDGGFDVDFSFADDFLHLNTRVGSFKIDYVPLIKNTQETIEAKSELAWNYDWLTRDGQRFLWLPPGAYRTAKFAHFHGLMTFGTSNGRVIFLEISFDKLDRSLARD